MIESVNKYTKDQLNDIDLRVKAQRDMYESLHIYNFEGYLAVHGLDPDEYVRGYSSEIRKVKKHTHDSQEEVQDVIYRKPRNRTLYAVYHNLLSQMPLTTPKFSISPMFKKDEMKSMWIGKFMENIWETGSYSERVRKAYSSLLLFNEAIALYSYDEDCPYFVDMKIINPCNFHCDNWTCDIQDTSWVAIDNYFTIEEFRREYPYEDYPEAYEKSSIAGNKKDPKRNMHVQDSMFNIMFKDSRITRKLYNTKLDAKTQEACGVIGKGSATRHSYYDQETYIVVTDYWSKTDNKFISYCGDTILTEETFDGVYPITVAKSSPDPLADRTASAIANSAPISRMEDQMLEYQFDAYKTNARMYTVFRKDAIEGELGAGDQNLMIPIDDDTVKLDDVIRHIQPVKQVYDLDNHIEDMQVRSSQISGAVGLLGFFGGSGMSASEVRYREKIANGILEHMMTVMEDSFFSSMVKVIVHLIRTYNEDKTFKIDVGKNSVIYTPDVVVTEGKMVNQDVRLYEYNDKFFSELIYKSHTLDGLVAGYYNETRDPELVIEDFEDIVVDEQDYKEYGEYKFEKGSYIFEEKKSKTEREVEVMGGWLDFQEYIKQKTRGEVMGVITDYDLYDDKLMHRVQVVRGSRIDAFSKAEILKTLLPYTQSQEKLSDAALMVLSEIFDNQRVPNNIAEAILDQNRQEETPAPEAPVQPPVPPVSPSAPLQTPGGQDILQENLIQQSPEQNNFETADQIATQTNNLEGAI